jgi:hypothetical protein
VRRWVDAQEGALRRSAFASSPQGIPSTSDQPLWLAWGSDDSRPLGDGQCKCVIPQAQHLPVLECVCESTPRALAGYGAVLSCMNVHLHVKDGAQVAISDSAIKHLGKRHKAFRKRTRASQFRPHCEIHGYCLDRRQIESHRSDNHNLRRYASRPCRRGTTQQILD